MAKTNSSTRETRAQALIDAGAVTLLPGTGTALVRGSGQAEYIVTKEACTCPDFTKREVECKHRLATRELCRLYRECSREARATGRTRLPYALGLALRGRAVVRPATDWAAIFRDASGAAVETRTSASHEALNDAILSLWQHMPEIMTVTVIAPSGRVYQTIERQPVIDQDDLFPAQTLDRLVA